MESRAEVSLSEGGLLDLVRRFPFSGGLLDLVHDFTSQSEDALDLDLAPTTSSSSASLLEQVLALSLELFLSLVEHVLGPSSESLVP